MGPATRRETSSLGPLIDSLDKSLFTSGRLNNKGELRFVYGILCDVVHPSWGGDFIYPAQTSSNEFDEMGGHNRFRLTAVMFCLPVVELVKHQFQLTQSLEGDEMRKMLG